MGRKLGLAGLVLGATQLIGTGSLTTCYAIERDRETRLVLQVTVDQLRGDFPLRYFERLGEGGFKRLWKSGAVFRDAHHAHANTDTIVGHVTLATGAHPATHGMIGNVWFDREDREMKYSVEDAGYRLLTEGAGIDRQTEIDPTQKAARSDGRSPSAILVSTLADELAISTGGEAKIFSVSVKDRAAIAMAGHAGKAFWFSKASGQFVTSNYYYDRYPDWVEAWNAARPASRYEGQYWNLSRDTSTYVLGGHDDRPWETDVAGFGRTFPHFYGRADDGYFMTRLTIGPAGDELTLDFAKELIVREGLGRDEVPDYLSISFSTTDYVGHMFGPFSLEAEDNLLRLDRTIAALLSFVDERVGLANVLIVLSSDHGGAETPGYLAGLGVPAGYVSVVDWADPNGLREVRRKFGLATNPVAKYRHPYVYLDHRLIEAEGLSLTAVSAAVAAAIEESANIAMAVTPGPATAGLGARTSVVRSVDRARHPQRSGDVFVVFRPGWFINDADGLRVASTHGSPWRYDTYVPLLFAGPGIRPQQVARRVYTVDVAPTLAAYLGIKPPSGSEGQPLAEVLER